MANSLSFGVKFVLKTARGSKTFDKIQAAMEAFDRPYRMMDRYLRPQLADGLDHSGRRFFKTLWEKNLGPRKEKVNFRQGGMFNYFYRLPKGYAGNRTFRALERSSSVRAFIDSKAKTMDMAAELFSDSKVAKYQEEGGTISGKGGKMAVPMPRDFKASEFMYDSTGWLKRRYKNPRGLGLIKLKLSGAKGTQTYLCKKYKHSKRITPMYVLKDSVTLKKPMLRYKKLFDEMRPQTEKILEDSMKKGLDELRAAV